MASKPAKPTWARDFDGSTRSRDSEEQSDDIPQATSKRASALREIDARVEDSAATGAAAAGSRLRLAFILQDLMLGHAGRGDVFDMGGDIGALDHQPLQIGGFEHQQMAARQGANGG